MTNLTATAALTGCVVCDSDPKPFHATMPARPMGEVAGRPVHLSCQHEAKSAIEYGTGDTITVEGGVARWKSNGRSPFDDLIRKVQAFGYWAEVDEAATAAARDGDTAAFLAAYRAAQPAQPSAEERFEMLAAFGPGETVVDVFTGRRVTL